MFNTPDSPAKSPVGYTTQGGNYWTLITPEIWKVLHAVLHKRRILELARSLPTTARKLQSASGVGFAGNAVVEQIIALIEQRCALTIRRLTDPAAENDAAAEPSG